MSIWILITVVLVAVIAVLVWYIRKILLQLKVCVDNVEHLRLLFIPYNKFLENMYELQIFYGDDTLKSLIDYSKDIKRELERFSELFSVDGDEEVFEEEVEDFEEVIDV
jgi:hypothetical protein